MQEYKSYFSNLTTTYKLRKERWKDVREPRKRDGQQTTSQATKIESYWKIMTRVEKATGRELMGLANITQRLNGSSWHCLGRIDGNANLKLLC